MGDTVTNVHVYAEEWATKLQERLSEEVKWKDICKVDYTNSKVLHNPYLTEATVQTGYRGTTYTYQAFAFRDGIQSSPSSMQNNSAKTWKLGDTNNDGTLSIADFLDMAQ